MKKLILLASMLGCISFGTFAQSDNKSNDNLQKNLDEKLQDLKNHESEQIIINRIGDKDKKITVEIHGNDILINGKPMSEYKDGDITINKRSFKFHKNGNDDFGFSPRAFSFSGPTTVYSNIKRNGGFLGVQTENESDNNKESGLLIKKVVPKSAAEVAGLKEGDYITKVDDTKITDQQSLVKCIGSHKPSEEVTIYYSRDGKAKSTKAVLGESPENITYEYKFKYSPNLKSLDQLGQIPNFNGKGFDPRQFEEMQKGFDRMGDMFPSRPKLGLRIQDTEDGKGVKVLNADADSPAQKAGLQKDDVITEIEGKKINNTDDAREQLKANVDNPSYTIKAKRNGKEMNFEVKIPKKLRTINL